MRLVPNNPKPIEIVQRVGESILYTLNATDILDKLELISKVECPEAESARPRKGKAIEMRIYKPEINKTAAQEDFVTKITCQTSLGNVRVIPIKIRILR